MTVSKHRRKTLSLPYLCWPNVQTRCTQKLQKALLDSSAELAAGPFQVLKLWQVKIVKHGNCRDTVLCLYDTVSPQIHTWTTILTHSLYSWRFQSVESLSSSPVIVDHLTSLELVVCMQLTDTSLAHITACRHLDHLFLHLNAGISETAAEHYKACAIHIFCHYCLIFHPASFPSCCSYNDAVLPV